mmetsp:Transcript_122733/g.223059  ORF Transcript_122733/g.223059 Transcript_122733/m.223059 type:complete len:968 (+) Transcript_122733:103-3006(+)
MALLGAAELRALPLLLFGLLCGCTDSSVENCFTFYPKDAFGETSAACKEECLYRTTCDGDAGRSTCVQSEQNCKDLLPRGQLISGWVNYSNGSAVRNYTCQSCFLNGCKTCAAGNNGTVICQVCDGHFKLDGKGGCEWNEKYWGYAMIAVIVACFLLGLWVFIDFLRAECSTATNSDAVERGLLTRRRSKVLRRKEILNSDGTKGESFHKPSFFTNLFKAGASDIGGPGMTLFMNWWLFMLVLALWLALGAIVLAPSSDDDKEYMDPCRQQTRGGQGDMVLKHPGNPDDDDTGPFASWTIWNFAGSVVITVAFFIYAEYLWAHMVRDWKRPALQEYCVEFSNMPRELKDKKEIRRLVGDWMAHLHLDPLGIRHISVAYNIPADMKGKIEEKLELHLHEVADSRASRFVQRHNLEIMDDSEVQKAGPFWIQLGAHILLQTPLDLGCCRSAPVRDDAGASDSVGGKGDQKAACPEVLDMLDTLQGSGYVYVLMDTEALALAVGGMGIARLDGYGGRKIRVRKAPLGPEMVRWYDFAYISPARRAFLIVKVSFVLLVVLVLWLGAFAFYLSFELITMGDSSYHQLFISTCVVGLSVPIGNAIFGVVIELQTETLSFRDEENLRLCRLALNVILNAIANFGEIYLVFKKVFDPTGWKIADVPWEFKKALQPVGINPDVAEFQTQMRDILWPFGLLIPIFMIPCVETLAPFLLGRLRLKQDARLTPLDAENILKPPPVDIVSNYSDMLINITLVTTIFWISPGRYHIILWIGVALWSILQGIVMQLNILWWQAHGYVGGKDSHQCSSHLLALPLGLMAANVEREWNRNRSGIMFFMFYCTLHFIFLQYVLPRFFFSHDCWGTTFDEMMQDANAPVINYRNTNPIEVLQARHKKDSEHQDLVFYRHDKWYLQNKTHVFEGETCIKAEAQSILSGLNAQAVDVVTVVGNSASDQISRVSKLVTPKEDQSFHPPL